MHGLQMAVYSKVTLKPQRIMRIQGHQGNHIDTSKRFPQNTVADRKQLPALVVETQPILAAKARLARVELADKPKR